MNKIPIVDVDSVIYRAGFAADSQKAKEIFGETKGLDPKIKREALAKHDYLAWALANTKSVMEDILHNVFATAPEYKAYLSGKYNFREQLAQILPYKGNRDPDAKPKYYSEIKQYLIDVWKCEVIDGMEADDKVGIEQYKAKDQSTCIVSIDKDLNCIPGHHYNWVKREFYYVTLKEANINFFSQMLEGDTTDNIPGIKGVGPAGVRKLLASAQGELAPFIDAVQQLYRKQYGDTWVGAYNEVASLLWILREEGKPCPYRIGE